MILRHAFTPPNNTRLTNLCGPLDAHLRTIELGTSTKIAHRHEHFKVEGPKAQAMWAMEIIQALYEMAAHPLSEEKLQLMLTQDLGSHTDVWVGSLRGKKSSKGAARTLLSPHSQEVPTLLTKRPDLSARSTNQAHYLDSIAAHDITFGIGPAGTGKTYLAVACAVDALERASVQRIILTRPAVEAGEKLGFLPGDLGQKVDPYLRPLYDALYDLMGFDKVQKCFERQILEIAPLAFMRGRTLNHAFVILDEAQNTTPEQMKMFLTRMGFGAKAVITGDVSQIDLPKSQPSGLIDAERVLKRVQGVGFVNFTTKDVVRHPLVARIVDAYASKRSPLES